MKNPKILFLLALFTLLFGLQQIQAQSPGGVNTNLSLWLKADAGATSSLWEDQSVNGRDVTQGTAANQPTYNTTSNLMNFNPTYSFDGGDVLFRGNTNSSEYTTSTSGSIFAVGTKSISGSNAYFNQYPNAGNFASHFAEGTDGTVINYGGGGQGTGGEVGLNMPTISSGVYTNTGATVYLQGAQIGTLPITNSGVNPTMTAAVGGIGSGTNSANPSFNGLMTEVIIFNRDVTPTERNQVESYLAIKYGITLGASSNDYVDSNGSSIYNLASYSNDVFGIGNDSDSGLNQQVSKSVNSGAILAISTNSNFTVANGTRPSLADGQFLVIGNNGGATTTQSTETPAGQNLRVTREWRVENTGSVPATNIFLQFEGFDDTWTLYTDTDGDFSDATAIGNLSASGLIGRVALTDGMYLTLAKTIPVPGGVSTDLRLWLKADGETFVDGATVTTATEFSGNANNGNGTGHSPLYENDAANNINFNPVYDFNGSSQYLQYTSLLGSTSHSEATVYTIQKAKATSGGSLFGEKITGGGAYRFMVHAPFSNGTTFWLANSNSSWETYTASPSAIGRPTFNTFGVSATNGEDKYIRENGVSVDDGSNTLTTFTGNNSPFYIGAGVIADGSNNPGFFANASIAEAIVYIDGGQSTNERQQIESYLALKYGFTLDQTTATDYLASDGSTIWDASVNTAYSTDIFGIGRDDTQALNQRVSKSVNTGTVLTTALDNDFASANNDTTNRPTAFANDLEFVTFANNGGATTAQSTEIGGSSLPGAPEFNTRPTREWQVQNPDGILGLNLKFEGFGGYDLIASTDDNFSTLGDNVIIGTLNANGEISGVNLADGAYFTLAKYVQAPGGVSTDLRLWLKADDTAAFGLTGSAIDTWTDTGRSITFADTPLFTDQAQFVANSADFNFNPTVDFTANATQLEHVSNTLIDINDDTLSFYAVTHGVGGSADQSVFIYANGGNTTGVTGLELNAKVFADARGFNVPNTVINNGTHISTFSSVDDTDKTYYYDGQMFSATVSGAGRGGNSNEDEFNIGSYAAGGNPFDGSLAELIVFGDSATPLERQKIESYLALKYGITLRQENTGSIQTTFADYIANDGSLMWSAAKSLEQVVVSGGFTLDKFYAYNVFGIGRDDASDLNQKVATSVNSDAILSVALEANFTDANNDAARTTNHTNDLQFITFGHDGFDNGTRTTELDATTGFNTRLKREWKTQRTANMTQNITLKFEGRGGWSLITVANGEDFSSGVTTVGQLNANGEITVTAAQLPDSIVFTLAQFVEAPGGVSTDLALWLKADDNITAGLADGASVSSWADQSGNSYVATNSAGDGQTEPNYDSSDLINFNPSVAFNGTSSGLDLGSNYIYSENDGLSIYAVAVPNNNNVVDRRFIFDFGNFSTFGYGLHYESDRFGMYASTDLGGSNDNEPHTIGNNPALLTANYDFGTQQTGSLNGLNLISEPITYTKLNEVEINESSPRISGSGPVTIGRQSKSGLSANRKFDGRIAEVIVYTNDTQTSAQQIQSYLAIKYGITLDASSADYVASNGSSIYNLASYNNDVFGIANDVASDLDQQISKSANTGAVLTISTDTNFTGANGTHTSLTDGQYLVVGNDGASGAPADAISTDLNTATYFERSAREWKVQNTGGVGAVNLQFDGYDDSWVLLTRTTDGDFSATTGTTATALSATGSVSTTLAGTTYFTLAKLTTSIEFEAATANDVEATGGNLPSLLIDGTLAEDTFVDVVINAAATATASTDYTFADATGDAAVTVPVNIPSGTYTSGTPVALSGLDYGQRLLERYPSVINNASEDTQREETFVAKYTGSYTLTFSAETFTAFIPGSPNGYTTIGTTSGVTGGSRDVFDGSLDRIDGATPSKTYTVSLTAGTTYYVYSAAGGTSAMNSVELKLEYLQPLNFAITEDTEVEADETIDITLSNAQSGLTIQEVTGGSLIDNHVYTITNDDNLTVDFASATFSEVETATNLVVNLTVTGGSITATETVEVSVTGGTATAADYSATSPITVTMPVADYTNAANQTVAVNIPLTDDSFVEIDETIALELTNPSANLSIGTTQTTSVATITDDDATNLTISIVQTTDGAEGTTPTAATFTVSLDGGVTNNTGSVITGTIVLTGEATAADYTAVTGFSIANGVSSAVITVPVLDDSIVEDTETIIATISAPNVGSVSATANATANITDDDTAEFTVAPTALTLSENGGTGTFTLVLNSAPISDVVIDLSSDDTAEASIDIAQVTFTSANWDQPQTITVTGVDDTEVGNATATITAAINAAGSDDAFDALTNQSVAVTLTNEDVVIGITPSITDITVDENGGTQTFTVILGSQPPAGQQVFINVVSNDTGEATVALAQLTFDDTNWDQPQTVTVTGVDDSALLDDATTITLSVDPASDANFTALPNQTVNVALINDDASTGTNGTEISGEDGAAIANNTDIETIRVQLKDDAGNTISRAGIAVTFAVTGSASLSSATATTDANGVATVNVTNTVAETVSVTATVDTDNDAGAATAELAVVNGSPIAIVFSVDNANPDPTNVNTTIEATSPVLADGIANSIVTIQLADANGNLLTASGGTIVLTSTGNGMVTSIVDNGNGTYTGTVTNLTAETVSVTATLDGVAITDDASIEFITDNTNPDPSNVNTTIDATGPIIADGTTTSTVTIQLADFNGNLLTASGGTVVVSSTGNAAQVGTVIDNNNGTYTATFSNLLVETVTISATLNGVTITDTASVEYILDSNPGCIVNCDTNGDGTCDLNCDTNGDGTCDVNCDTNGDGTCDVNCDTNGDGTCDLNCDTNGDGTCDLNCDTNGDGTCDLNCDTNGDGTCDLNCDTNGDGTCDLNCDTNGDGTCDLNCDTNGDGTCDLNCDTNGDGTCDVNCDTNGDGTCDLNCDTNGDGTCDLNCDTNGDGTCDLNCDTNGDGTCDLNCDTNGDGTCDVNCDTNGDGTCDVNCDTNGDGTCDRNCDTNGDGTCDLNCDTNGDGTCDLNCDTNGDGTCDLNCDTNGDGTCDLNCDTNGDGTCDLNCDTNGDGTCDLNCDTNGDGTCDLNCDTNGDGTCDLNCDTNGDGTCDLNCDTNGDGACDLNCDTNGDGTCDLNCDTNGDGTCDLNCDTNGDGTCDLNCDTNGDGTCDLNCDTNDDGTPDTNIDTDGDGDCDTNCTGSRVLDQIGNEADSPDNVPSVVTVEQLASIPGITNVEAGNQDAYRTYIDENPDLFSEPATLAEVQAMIDEINSIAEIVANSNDPADGNPSLTELADVGVTDLNPDNQDLYEEAIANANPAPVTLEDLQDIINAVNNGEVLSAVTISKDDIATAITPNGDGINDGWVIRGIENYPNNVVKVYNRQGHEVFGAQGYQNNWEGFYNDNREKLPPGSYYYVVNLGDGSAPIDGWIFINY